MKAATCKSECVWSRYRMRNSDSGHTAWVQTLNHFSERQVLNLMNRSIQNLRKQCVLDLNRSWIKWGVIGQGFLTGGYFPRGYRPWELFGVFFLGVNGRGVIGRGLLARVLLAVRVLRRLRKVKKRKRSC